jgi:O-antigen/teichoic acid export membrane protein
MDNVSSLKKKTRTAVYWEFFNKFSNQGLAFVFSIILARILSPSDYGIIALPLIFFALAQCLIDCGFSAALIRKPQITEGDLSTAFYFNIIVGGICYFLLFCFSPLIADFYNTPILCDILKVTALSMIFTPLQSVHYAVLRRNLNYKTPALISLCNCVVSGITGIALAYSGFGVWALVFQGLAGNVVNLVMLWYLSKWRPSLVWSNDSFSYLFGFGGKMLASGIIDVVHDNICSVAVGKFYSVRELGLYNRSQGYAQLPFLQINGVMDGVSFPVLSKLQEDDSQLSQAFIRLLKLVCFVICPIMLCLSALAYPLVVLMITDKWAECVPLLQVLCFAIMLWPIHTLNFTLLKVKGRSDLLLKLNIGIKVLGFIIMSFTIPNGVMAIGYGSIVHALLVFLWITYYMGRVSNVSMVSQIKSILPNLALGGSMYALIVFVTFFIDSMLIKLLVGGVLGISYYFLMAYFLGFSQIKDLKFFLKRE